MGPFERAVLEGRTTHDGADAVRRCRSTERRCEVVPLDELQDFDRFLVLRAAERNECGFDASVELDRTDATRVRNLFRRDLVRKRRFRGKAAHLDMLDRSRQEALSSLAASMVFFRKTTGLSIERKL